MISTSATPYVVPQIGKIRSANHFGRKMSVTEPRTAPKRSVRIVNGHVQPDTAKIMLSRRTSPTATHVHVVMRSAMPLNKAKRTHALRSQKIRVWMTLTWKIVTFSIGVSSPGLPNRGADPRARWMSAGLPADIQRAQSPGTCKSAASLRGG